MNDFTLHDKLRTDCIELGSIQNSLLLLMNNSLVPWFIIVPRTIKLELHELSEKEQTELITNINRMSDFVAQNFRVDKLNVASIGNVVVQMHIHIIGRRHDDYCWPDVVWGKTDRVEYKAEEIKQIVNALRSGLENYVPLEID